jgi:hypothetical protein
MTGFVVGLLVAFGGAMLLASGSELQSRAVYRAHGRWRTFLRAPRWLLGLLLLATAVSTNFVALALTPVSAVQSVSIVALAVSAAIGALSGRIVVGKGIIVAIVLCMTGSLGSIAVIAAHQSGPARTTPGQLTTVTVILALLTAIGIVVVVAGRRSLRRRTHLAGLISGSTIFGCITTLFKVVVSLVMADGLAVTLGNPLVIAAIGVVALGGVVANILLQRAHRVFPAPAVVAGLTVVDPLTAAVIGLSVLAETRLTPASGVVLALFGAIAFAGVLGLGRLRRRTSPTDGGVSGIPEIPSHQIGTDNHAHCVL